MISHSSGSLFIGTTARRYSQPSESEAAKKVFDGRTFDGNRISARYVSEDDFKQAETGVWNQASNGSLPPPPGARRSLPTTGGATARRPRQSLALSATSRGLLSKQQVGTGQERKLVGTELRARSVRDSPVVMLMGRPCVACRNDWLQSPGRRRAARDADGVSERHGARHAGTTASSCISRRIPRGGAAGSASRILRAASSGRQHAGGCERRLGEAARRELHGQQAGLHDVFPGAHRTTSLR